MHGFPSTIPRYSVIYHGKRSSVAPGIADAIGGEHLDNAGYAPGQKVENHRGFPPAKFIGNHPAEWVFFSFICLLKTLRDERKYPIIYA
jgi:hypothetical protein